MDDRLQIHCSARRAAIGLLFALLLPMSGCDRSREPAATSADIGPARDSVTGLLQGDSAGFAVADRVRPIRLPADHAAHPAYRTEWWYFTGHLHAADGRRFGFQYTVFRQALRAPELAPQRTAARSRWRSDTVWLAHLAITDVAAQQHSGRARVGRGALGLGGVAATADGGLQIDVDGWRLQRHLDGVFAIDAGSLQLRLQPRSAPVLHGAAGLSRKGPNSASYYFSIPRLAVDGRLRTAAGEVVAVTGSAWLDREWSTSALAPEQIGWDWFSLNLDDGRDLMLFRLRRRDGRPDAFDAGTLVHDGVTTALAARDFQLTPRAWWQDEAGRRWPIGWQLRIARRASGEAPLQLQVRALVADQLMRVGLEYWEGAVEVRSDGDGAPSGRGYLELTGYGPE